MKNNLPFELRQLLGPMLLVGIIPSGLKGNEPKFLEPYLEQVKDEITQLTEFPVFSSYAAAPVTVNLALLQFLCDIPAFSKVFHLSGHRALRSLKSQMSTPMKRNFHFVSSMNQSQTNSRKPNFKRKLA